MVPATLAHQCSRKVLEGRPKAARKGGRRGHALSTQQGCRGRQGQHEHHRPKREYVQDSSRTSPAWTHMRTLQDFPPRLTKSELGLTTSRSRRTSKAYVPGRPSGSSTGNGGPARPPNGRGLFGRSWRWGHRAPHGERTGSGGRHRVVNLKSGRALLLRDEKPGRRDQLEKSPKPSRRLHRSSPRKTLRNRPFSSNRSHPTRERKAPRSMNCSFVAARYGTLPGSTAPTPRST